MRLFHRKPGKLLRWSGAESAKVLRGRPREMPSAKKLDELRAVCAHHPAVSAAFLIQQFIPGPGETPTIVLGLTFDDPSQASATFQDIGEALHPLRPGDKSLDFEALDERPSEPWISVYQRS